MTFLLTSCLNDSEKQVADSKRIYEQLRGNRIAPYQNAYRHVVLKRESNPVLAKKADSLMQSTSELADFIDSLISVVKSMDPVGARFDIGKKLLVNSPVGRRLNKSAQTISQLSLNSMKDPKNLKEAEMHLSKYKGYLGEPEFMEISFSTTSISFILMSLYGLKLDMIHVTYLALADIDSRMKG